MCVDNVNPVIYLLLGAGIIVSAYYDAKLPLYLLGGAGVVGGTVLAIQDNTSTGAAKKIQDAIFLPMRPMNKRNGRCCGL